MALFHRCTAPSRAWSSIRGLLKFAVGDLLCCGTSIGLKQWWVPAVVVCPQRCVYSTFLIAIDSLISLLVAGTSAFDTCSWCVYFIICCLDTAILSLYGCRPRQNVSCGVWCRWRPVVNPAKLLYCLSCWLYSLALYEKSWRSAAKPRLQGSHVMMTGSGVSGTSMWNEERSYWSWFLMIGDIISLEC